MTAVVDAATFKSADSAAAFANARRAGATVVRLVLDWSVVAPAGAAPPEGFVPTRPDDPRYDWANFDRQVREAVSLGLAPIADIIGAPAWAQRPPAHRRTQDGPYWPKYTALGAFARAAALRYSGVFGDLPRVRYWMVWNEPNFSWYLSPQQVEGRLVSPGWYRAMVNAVAASVHAVRRDNLVVAGGLAPYGTTNATLDATSPLLFMRRMLCLSDGPKPKRTCSKRATFDVWSHHPYTSGGPTREAGRRDDVSLGDLDQMAAVLRTAERVGTIRSSGRVRFWVTEFSWDTSPPDPKGVPMELHARWVAEALYRMWRDGVSLVTWFLVRDEPFPDVSTQSGLFFRGRFRPGLRHPEAVHAGVPLPVRRAPTDASPGALLGPHADERGGHRDRGALGREGVETSGPRPGGIVRDLHRHHRLDPPDRLAPGAHRSRGRGVGPVLPPGAARPGRVPVRRAEPVDNGSDGTIYRRGLRQLGGFR